MVCGSFPTRKAIALFAHCNDINHRSTVFGIDLLTSMQETFRSLQHSPIHCLTFATKPLHQPSTGGHKVQWRSNEIVKQKTISVTIGRDCEPVDSDQGSQREYYCHRRYSGDPTEASSEAGRRTERPTDSIAHVPVAE
jgi:hypothetical protein